METYTLNQDDTSLLHKLKSSIDQVRMVRKKSSDSPKRLEIKMSSSYILKDKAIEYNSLLSVIPEMKEEKLLKKLQGSPFSTKVQFVKPQQRMKEDSPCSVKSIHNDKIKQRRTNSSATIKELLEERMRKGRSLKEMGSERNRNNELEMIEKRKKEEIQKKREEEEEKIRKMQEELEIARKILEEEEIIRKIAEEREIIRRQKEEYEKVQRAAEELEKVQRAKEEIHELRSHRSNLQAKVQILEDSLSRMLDADQDEYERIASIQLKLEKLENQQILPEEDTRLPEAISKVSNLESEIVQLKSLKDSSVIHYEEELKDVYKKLKDLQECNEILSEMVACFRKEPLIPDKEYRNEETCTETLNKEVLGTIKLAGLLNSESILNEAYAKKEQLLQTKEKLEAEYRSIPNDSKSLANKRRKLALEFELSVNYSQLVATNSKIARYTDESN